MINLSISFIHVILKKHNKDLMFILKNVFLYFFKILLLLSKMHKDSALQNNILYR